MEIIKLFVPKNISESRYTMCKSCDSLSTLKFCKECGCFMPAKTKLFHADCPLKKWGSPMNSWGGV
jgi:hypothetical protein